jgi:branched-chain amino acid transport system ATP-binding protein
MGPQPDQNQQNLTASLRGMTLSFGGVNVLMDVSMDISKAELLALIGPNGAGKTSLLNCISGFYHPQLG